MRAYSLDLRQRVVEAVEDGGGTIEEVAALLRVGQTFVKKMLRQWRDTGNLESRSHGGGATATLLPQPLRALKAQVAREPDATLEELRQALQEQERGAVSVATIGRALQALELP